MKIDNNNDGGERPTRHGGDSSSSNGAVLTDRSKIIAGGRQSTGDIRNYGRVTRRETADDKTLAAAPATNEIYTMGDDNDGDVSGDVRLARRGVAEDGTMARAPSPLRKLPDWDFWTKG
jgi:hypothetical protein